MRESINDSHRQSIREFQDADAAEVVRVWHRSGSAAYPYLPTWQALTIETAQSVFHNIRCRISVASIDDQS